MEDGHIKTVEETLNYFGTDPERGLSLDQIKRNQEKYGPNGEYLRIPFILRSIASKIEKSRRNDNNCIKFNIHQM